MKSFSSSSHSWYAFQFLRLRLRFRLIHLHRLLFYRLNSVTQFNLDIHSRVVNEFSLYESSNSISRCDAIMRKEYRWMVEGVHQSSSSSLNRFVSFLFTICIVYIVCVGYPLTQFVDVKNWKWIVGVSMMSTQNALMRAGKMISYSQNVHSLFSLYFIPLLLMAPISSLGAHCGEEKILPELLTPRRRCCSGCLPILANSCRFSPFEEIFRMEMLMIHTFLHVTHIAQHLNVLACRYFSLFHAHNEIEVFPWLTQSTKFMYCLCFLLDWVIHHMIRVVIFHPRVDVRVEVRVYWWEGKLQRVGNGKFFQPLRLCEWWNFRLSFTRFPIRICSLFSAFHLNGWKILSVEKKSKKNIFASFLRFFECFLVKSCKTLLKQY